MHTTLRVALIIYALSLFVIIIHLLKKDRLPENYATLWFAFSIIILLCSEYNACNIEVKSI